MYNNYDKVILMKYAIFSDFDGTISMRDVGYSLFHHFSSGKNDALLPDWKAGRMTSRQVLVAEAEMVDASPEEIYAFIDSIGIDSGFPILMKKCAVKNIPIKILSDGLDVYIKYLLEKANLSHLDFKANKAELVDNTIKIHFSHTNKNCTSCGICKGEVIKDFKDAQKEPYQVIFIGDGYSDVCATKEADILFAKKDLKEYCIREDINFIPYKNFEDILVELKQKNIL